MSICILYIYVEISVGKFVLAILGYMFGVICVTNSLRYYWRNQIFQQQKCNHALILFNEVLKYILSRKITSNRSN